MTRIAICIAALVLAQPVLAGEADREVCSPRQVVLEAIHDLTGEELVFRGLANDESAVLEITHNKKTGTFTVFRSRPDGTTCQIGYGDYGFVKIPKLPGADS